MSLSWFTSWLLTLFEQHCFGFIFTFPVLQVTRVVALILLGPIGVEDSQV
jgi:hypothetical protein